MDTNYHRQLINKDYQSRNMVCGMVSFTCNNEDIALIVGGYGSPTETPQLNATYVTPDDDGDVVTNELYMYTFSRSTGEYKNVAILYVIIILKVNGAVLQYLVNVLHHVGPLH